MTGAAVGIHASPAPSSAEELGAIDLSDVDAFVDGVPYAWFDALRREDPVHWQAERDGRGFWAVTRHVDVVAVSWNWKTFSSEAGGSALEDLEIDVLAARRSMIDTDPPLQRDLRRLVTPPFLPSAVRDYEGVVRDVARTVVAEAVDMERFDLVDQVAMAVPIKVLCRLLGVPEADEPLLIRLGDQMIANTDPDLTAALLDGPDSGRYRMLPFRSPAALEMFDYSRRLSEARRRDPRDDLVSALVHGTIDGQPLDQREIDVMFLLLVVAGNETTRQAVALSVHALLEHRDQLKVLRGADEEGWRTAVEELLRWTTPLHHFRRTAVEPAEIGERRIAAGDKVVVWYTSANRDDRIFAEPYRLDLRRWPNPHTTFGRGGPHRCLGEHLARLELRVVLQELLRPLARMEPDGEPVRIRSNFTNGLKQLPVRLR